MRLETLFGKFELFADAPDAVTRMRELVLELAVRGQLSERLPNDQDDSAWRAFIKEFDNRIYGSDPGPPPPFNVPKQWRWACLDDVGTTKVRNDVDDAASVSFVPMTLISATYGVPVQFEERNWGEIKKGFTHFADNDVVMAKITPCFENAKSAVMRNLINGVGAGTTELHVFRSTTKVILPDYVLLYIKTRGFISRGESRMTGSAGQKRVPREYFATSPFPLPPLAEQKRIVAKVDELMALCDRLEAQQQERDKRQASLARGSLLRFAAAPTLANLNLLFHSSFNIHPSDLRKSILSLAVQGKLGPQDPNDEPAEALVARLKAELSENSDGRRKGESLPEIAPEEIPFDLPNGWVWERLGAIGVTNIGLTYSPQDVSDSGIPVLRSSNIQNGKLDFADLVRVNCEPKQSVMVRDGDLLICARNGSRALVGKVAVIENLDEPAAFGAFMAIFRSGVNRYLYHFICSPLFRRMIDEVNTTTINQITQNNLRTTFAPIPPLAEQRRIVAKVEQLMALVDALETQLVASRATAAKLLSALVANLTGTKSNVKASSSAGSGRRGRPRIS